MIEKLIADFLGKYGAGDPKHWNDKEFEKVSTLLEERTRIRISVNTLKRLFGKIKTQANYTPQNASLNALSCYLGFDNYHEYKKGKGFPREGTAEENGERNFLRIALGLIVLLLFVLTYVYWRKANEAEHLNRALDMATFRNEVGVKVHPYSSNQDSGEVTFIYDSPRDEKAEQQEAQFVLYGKVYPLNQARTIITETFNKPDIYYGRVFRGGEIVKSKAFTILSHGWLTTDKSLRPTKEFSSLDMYGAVNQYIIRY